MTKMKKIFRGGVWLGLKNLISYLNINCFFDIFYTPPLNFFFIFVMTPLRHFSRPFHWGSHSQNTKKPINFVGGFLRNLLKLKIAIPDCATRLTKRFIFRVCSILVPKNTQNKALCIRNWIDIFPKNKPSTNPF